MLLPSKASTLAVLKSKPFVNISNIRRSFEKHAKKLFVILEPLENMERKSIVTRSGRKASAISVVNKCKDKKKLVEINNESTRTKRDEFVTIRRGLKTTIGMKKSKSADELKKDLAVSRVTPFKDSGEESRVRSSKKASVDSEMTKDVSDARINESSTPEPIDASVRKRGRPTKNLLQVELNKSIAKRCSPRISVRNEIMNAGISNNKKVSENAVPAIHLNTKTFDIKSTLAKGAKSYAESKRERASKVLEKVVLNKSKVITNIGRGNSKSGKVVEESSKKVLKNIHSKRSVKKVSAALISEEIVETPVKTRNGGRKKIIDDIPKLKTPKKTVNFDKSVKDFSPKRQLRTRSVVKKCEQSNQGQENVNLKPKRVLIYKKDLTDSDSEGSQKNIKDVYKFTDDFLERSDVNDYDRDTDKIMCLIRKGERVKAKRKLKAKGSKAIRRPKIKRQGFVEVELLSHNIRTYQSNKKIEPKVLNIDPKVQNIDPKVQILVDVIVHAPIIENETNKALSAFDKLKTVKTPAERPQITQNNRAEDDDDDRIEVYQPDDLDSPNKNTSGPTKISSDTPGLKNTSPFMNNPKNTPRDLFVTQRRPVCYTSQVEPVYDRSNNFGFDDDEEQNSPEKSILINLNEVTRKLQKKTPWRNRLIMKNKRVLAVKNSSLPSVEQELLLDATMVDKLIRKEKKNEAEVSKKLVQTRLTETEEPVETSALFDESNLSPIKQIEATKKPSTRPNFILTPRQSFKRNILQSKNLQSTPNVIESEIDVEEGSDLDNSYFGFISPVANKKGSSKENVTVKRSPAKMPLRFDSVDLKRFRRKYMSKRQRLEEAKKLEAIANETDDVTVNETPVSDDDDYDVSDELPILGLFDELLQTEPEEERATTRKRARKYDPDATERISRTKNRRDKKAVSEFNKWANKFNKMCKEVEKHELFVE